MKITFHMKSGKSISTRYVKKFTHEIDGKMNITRYKITWWAGLLAPKNFTIDLKEVEAITS